MLTYFSFEYYLVGTVAGQSQQQQISLGISRRFIKSMPLKRVLRENAYNYFRSRCSYSGGGSGNITETSVKDTSTSTPIATVSSSENVVVTDKQSSISTAIPNVTIVNKTALVEVSHDTSVAEPVVNKMNVVTAAVAETDLSQLQVKIDLVNIQKIKDKKKPRFHSLNRASASQQSSLKNVFEIIDQ